MTSLMTQNAVTLSEVAAVPVPEHTRSWRPVPYMDAVGFLKDTIGSVLTDFTLRGEEYGLSKDGNQMFGVMTLDGGDESQSLAIGMRQSYNQSLSLGIAVGAQVMVCDNLMFTTSGFKIIRKNTVNVWAYFQEMARAQVNASYGHFQAIQADGQRMRELPVTQVRGFELLGHAVGERVLTPTQANVAFGDWREPRHPEFSPRNLWSLYNCVTEGLKKGAPAQLMNRHSNAHAFFTQAAANA